MTCVVLLNISIYIFSLIFAILFLFIVNFFFYWIILISWSRMHNKHVIFTYLMSRSRISWIKLIQLCPKQYFFHLFFFYCCCLIFFYHIVKLVKMFLNLFSWYAKNYSFWSLKFFLFHSHPFMSSLENLKTNNLFWFAYNGVFTI